MIPEKVISDVLAASNIKDIVSEFVTLKKKGVNYTGCCPFHNEKTASFTVSPAKNIYKCFGCGAGGTPIDFIMNHEAINFPQAVEYLAKKYGILIPTLERTPEEKKKEHSRDQLYSLNAIAQAFFAEHLKKHHVAQDYLQNTRHFDQSDIIKFGIGSIGLGWSELMDHFIHLGYNKEQLFEAGLIGKNSENRYFDRFRDRIMFPYYDLMGHVIGFTGRVIAGESFKLKVSSSKLASQPGAEQGEEGKHIGLPVQVVHEQAKYLNSPETEVFKKGRILYGIKQAKNAIARDGKAYLVEGNTDVIRFHKQEMENTICTSGTALTVEHARLIRRFTDNLTILFDGDSAGIKAALKGLDICIAEGLNVQVALLPAGEDPDSFAKGKSREEIYRWIEDNEKDFVRLYTEMAAEDIDNKPAEKGKLINEIYAIVEKVPDLATKESYFEMVSRMLKLDPVKFASKVFKSTEKGDDDLKGFVVNESAIKKADKVMVYTSKEAAMEALTDKMELEDHAMVVKGQISEKQIAFLSGLTKNIYFDGEIWQNQANKDLKDNKVIKVLKFVDHLRYLAENGFQVYVRCEDNSSYGADPVAFPTFYFDYLEINRNKYNIESCKHAIENAAEFLAKLDNTTVSLKTSEVAKLFGITKSDFSAILKPYLAKVKNKVQQRNEEIVIDDEHYVFSIDNLPAYVDQKFFNKFNHFAAQNKNGKKIFYVFANEHGSLVKVANFYMEPQFQVYSEDALKNKRIVKLNHADLNSSKFVEIPSNDMVEFGQFKKFLFRQGPYLLRNAKVYHLDTILDSIALQFPVALELTIFGQQPEDFYAFSNAIFGNGHIQEMNDLGLIDHDGKTYYSPSVSAIYKDARKDDDQFALDRFFVYRETNHTDFKKWSALVKDVYKNNDNGCWTVMMAIMCAFRSDIFKIDRLFTTLFFIGPTECGKSQLAQSIRALYVHPDASMFNLNSGTDAAFFTMLQRYRDAPVIMEEYNDQQISDTKFQGLKASVYDGEGKAKRRDVKGTDLDISQVNAVPILLGQEAPERDDASLANRCVLCHVPLIASWSDEETLNFQLLKSWEKQGLTGILIDILKHRGIIREHYHKKLRAVQKDMRDDLNKQGTSFQTRILNTISLFLAMVKLFEEYIPGLELPFTYAEFYDIAKKKLVSQSESISNTNRLAVFFDAFQLLAEDSKNGFIRGKEFKIEKLSEITIREGQNKFSTINFENDKKILFLRLEMIHPKYRDKVGLTEHLKMNNLQNYLKDHAAYLGSVKQTTFNWKVETRTADETGRVSSIMSDESRRTSAIAMDYDMLKDILGLDLGSESVVSEAVVVKSSAPVSAKDGEQTSMYGNGSGDGLPY
ncbi:MAG TPA: hypothetical protein DCL77_14415 [Prolixibacteraceae bacterium]|jgi:DNA primase|nr:hypothetical protein [Prolixibacteraceae bacterium]